MHIAVVGFLNQHERVPHASTANPVQHIGAHMTGIAYHLANLTAQSNLLGAQAHRAQVRRVTAVAVQQRSGQHGRAPVGQPSRNPRTLNPNSGHEC